MYTTAGEFQGDWALHSANTFPNGLTIDPSGVSDSIWVVDTDTDSVYEYHRDTGEFRGSFALDTAAGNSHPTGIADPPPPTARAAMPQPQSYRSDDEPRGNGALFSREALMVPAVLPQLPLEPWLRTEQREPSDVPVHRSDPAGDSDSVRDTWLVQLPPANSLRRPEAIGDAADVRLLDDISSEEAELLDEELLALIAAEQSVYFQPAGRRASGKMTGS
jgi:hypothetical protein